MPVIRSVAASFFMRCSPVGADVIRVHVSASVYGSYLKFRPDNQPLSASRMARSMSVPSVSVIVAMPCLRAAVEDFLQPLRRNQARATLADYRPMFRVNMAASAWLSTGFQRSAKVQNRW